MRHEAIKSAYPNAGVINGESDVWDQDGNVIEIDEALVSTQLTKLQAEYDAQEYARNRQYPSIGDQLDMLFHDMTAGKGSKTGEWYKAVAKAKADNPKPE